MRARTDPGPTLLGAGAGCALMIVGSLGPVESGYGTSLGYSSGGRDGVILIVLAVLAALLLGVRYLRGGARWALTFAAVIGALGVITTVADMFTLNSGYSPGWGIIVALIGSITLTIASVAALVRSQRGAPDSGPSGGPQPPAP